MQCALSNLQKKGLSTLFRLCWTAVVYSVWKERNRRNRSDEKMGSVALFEDVCNLVKHRPNNTDMLQENFER